MKNYILLLLLGVSSTYALELRFGQGDFEWKASMSGFMEGSVTLDDTVISLHEQHAYISNTPWYYFGNLDIHNSKTLNKVTDMADSLMDLLPLAPADFISPFPSTFKLSGIDLDIGVGYDVVKNEKGYLGFGIMTGISTPFMDMNNYLDTIEFINDVLKNTSTDVTTYKFGLTAQGAYNINPLLSVYTTGILATQIGEMSNELIDSSFDVSGTYTSLDLGVKYGLNEILHTQKNFYVNAGYTYKHWNIDEINVNFVGVNMPDIMTVIDSELTSDYFYLGMGYDF